MPKLFIVGRLLDPDVAESQAWEFVGVFSTRELAEGACTCWRCFVGPALLDVRTPETPEPTPWPDGYYPIARPAGGA